VVGIHHSGGMLPEPNTQRRHLRNAETSAIALLKRTLLRTATFSKPLVPIETRVEKYIAN
jgi:hypothetical protein